MKGKTGKKKSDTHGHAHSPDTCHLPDKKKNNYPLFYGQWEHTQNRIQPRKSLKSAEKQE